MTPFEKNVSRMDPTYNLNVQGKAINTGQEAVYTFYLRESSVGAGGEFMHLYI